MEKDSPPAEEEDAKEESVQAPTAPSPTGSGDDNTDDVEVQKGMPSTALLASPELIAAGSGAAGARKLTARGRKDAIRHVDLLGGNSKMSFLDRVRVKTELEMGHPIYVMNTADLLTLDIFPSYEDCLKSGIVRRYDPAAGSDIIFWSHQWLSQTHPDPEKVQLRTMQKAVRNLSTCEGVAKAFRAANATSHTRAFQMLGMSEEECASSMRSGVHWLDFWSIPQARTEEAHAVRLKAINAIPAYAKASRLLLSLCPDAKNLSTGEVCGFDSWLSRGWCRLERISSAWTHSTPNMILVRDAGNLEVLPAANQITGAQAVCNGAFTCCAMNHKFKPSGEDGPEEEQACDIIKVSSVLEVLMQIRCHDVLSKDDGIKLNYRVTRSLAKSFFANSVDVSDPAACGTQSVEDWLVEFGFVGDGAGSTDECGNTAAHWAAYSDNPQVLKSLVERGADVNAENDKVGYQESVKKWYFIGGGGATPLHAAVMQSSSECVDILLAAKANIDAPTISGRTALWMAASRKMHGIMRKLLAAGANADACTTVEGEFLNCPANTSALSLSCLVNDTEGATILLEAGANVNLANAYGLTPLLQNLVRNNNLEMVVLLVKHGADVTARYNVKLPDHVANFEGLGVIDLLSHKGEAGQSLSNYLVPLLKATGRESFVNARDDDGPALLCIMDVGADADDALAMYHMMTRIQIPATWSMHVVFVSGDTKARFESWAWLMGEEEEGTASYQAISKVKYYLGDFSPEPKLEWTIPNEREQAKHEYKLRAEDDEGTSGSDFTLGPMPIKARPWRSLKDELGRGGASTVYISVCAPMCGINLEEILAEADLGPANFVGNDPRSGSMGINGGGACGPEAQAEVLRNLEYLAGRTDVVFLLPNLARNHIQFTARYAKTLPLRLRDMLCVFVCRFLLKDRPGHLPPALQMRIAQANHGSLLKLAAAKGAGNFHEPDEEDIKRGNAYAAQFPTLDMPALAKITAEIYCLQRFVIGEEKDAEDGLAAFLYSCKQDAPMLPAYDAIGLLCMMNTADCIERQGQRSDSLSRMASPDDISAKTTNKPYRKLWELLQEKEPSPELLRLFSLGMGQPYRTSSVRRGGRETISPAPERRSSAAAAAAAAASSSSSSERCKSSRN